MKTFFVASLLFLTPQILQALDESDGGELIARRIHAHLLIRDVDHAIQEAKSGLTKFPQSLALRKAYLRALAEKGDEQGALRNLRTLLSFPREEKEDRHLFEILAWGALQKGQQSELSLVRLNAMLGAVFTQDIKAVPILIREMRSSNSLMRSVAVQLATMMGDHPLRQEILRLIREEKIWYVRLTALQAAGHLKIVEARPLLQEIIGRDKTIAEEKATAIMTLASLYDKVERDELKELVNSQRAGLRHLACELVSCLELKEEIASLVHLLGDSAPEVRVAALNGLGLLHVQQFEEKPLLENEKLIARLADSSPPVAITAAWLMLRLGDERGEKELKRWLSDMHPQWRRMAAAALSNCGSLGVPLEREMIDGSNDLFVKVHLALGLIGQRIEVEKSCQVIDAALREQVDKLWMWDASDNPLFQTLTESRVRHIEQVANYPVIVDQFVRLDLLSVLSMLRYPHALDTVRSFLKTGKWGVISSAAGTLMQEGEEEELEAVHALLSDPEEAVRIEAALMLALWGKDPAGIDVLIAAYSDASRERKMQILEALGRSGDRKAIPFLLEILGEPFQVLRIVAASALIQCLHQ